MTLEYVSEYMFWAVYHFYFYYFLSARLYFVVDLGELRLAKLKGPFSKLNLSKPYRCNDERIRTSLDSGKGYIPKDYISSKNALMLQARKQLYSNLSHIANVSKYHLGVSSNTDQILCNCNTEPKEESQ
jgi:hypothetical protein